MPSEPLIQEFLDLSLFLFHLCDVILYLCFFESLLKYMCPVPVLLILYPLVFLLQVFDAHLFEYIIAESLTWQSILSIFPKAPLATSDMSKTVIEIPTYQLNNLDNYENQENQSECSKFNNCMGTLKSLTRCEERDCQ
jgi:hypothetical protein